jgi:NAD(P)-dependent dehydrogenase (short-subunit alcohol dehydrogenase family)
MKRMPTLKEIANVACLICLPEASYLTAQTILVDGGLTLYFSGAP